MTDYQNLTYDDIIRAIRRVIKKAVPGLSVRKGRGTAYLWIDIGRAGDDYGAEFTDEQRDGLKKLGLSPCANVDAIGPHARRFWYERLVHGMHLDENEPAGDWD